MRAKIRVSIRDGLSAISPRTFERRLWNPQTGFIARAIYRLTSVRFVLLSEVGGWWGEQHETILLLLFTVLTAHNTTLHNILDSPLVSGVHANTDRCKYYYRFVTIQVEYCDINNNHQSCECTVESNRNCPKRLPKINYY